MEPKCLVSLSLGSQVYDLELGLKIIAREKCKHVFLEETIQIVGKKNLVQLLQLLQFRINYPRKEPLTNDFCILSTQKIYNPTFFFRKISFVMDGLKKNFLIEQQIATLKIQSVHH